MKPQHELEYLQGFIKLTEQQAIKRDALETFLENRDKVLLLDADSILYKVCHHHADKETSLEDKHEDFHAQVRAIANRIEDDGFNVEDIIYFFTTCTNNFRNEIYPEYKAHRKDDPIRKAVKALKTYCIGGLQWDYTGVYYSDTHEADDLIPGYVEDLVNIEDFIVCSIDKDLKQIPGAHFDYYKQKTGEIDQYGNDIREYKGWSYTTPQEGYDLFLTQMLIGDTADNIKGAKGVGEKRAPKLLAGKTNFGKLLTTARAYGDMERFRINVKLMRL
tara:strand:+ start:933 stop:1757 length:825 start_codon:yes stop_codon:yes gene_type:complete